MASLKTNLIYSLKRDRTNSTADSKWMSVVALSLSVKRQFGSFSSSKLRNAIGFQRT